MRFHQGLASGPLISSFLHTISLNYHIYYHLFANDLKISVSNRDLSSKVQNIFKCICHFSSWISQRHLKCNISKTKLVNIMPVWSFSVLSPGEWFHQSQARTPALFLGFSNFSSPRSNSTHSVLPETPPRANHKPSLYASKRRANIT